MSAAPTSTAKAAETRDTSCGTDRGGYEEPPPLSKPLSQDPPEDTDPFYHKDGSYASYYPPDPHASRGPPVKANPRAPTRDTVEADQNYTASPTVAPCTARQCTKDSAAGEYLLGLHVSV